MSRDTFPKQLLAQAFLLSACAFLYGCSVLKGSPAPDSGFLPHGERLLELSDRAPFQGLWYSDRDKLDQMKKEYVGMYMLPVETGVVEANLRASDAPEGWKRDRIEDLHEIARYMDERFKRSIAEYPNHPMKIVDEAGPKTFVVQIAIVELNPTDPALNTIGTAASFFVPGAGLIKYAATGSIAIEGILRDGETGASLVEWRDRATDKISAVSLKDYQQYAHVRESIDDWSGVLAELAATPFQHKVDGPLPFTLNPL